MFTFTHLFIISNLSKSLKIEISVQICTADSTTQSDSDATISYSDSNGEPYFFTDSGSSNSKHDENMVCNLMYEVEKLIKLSFIQLVISNVVKIILF